MVAAAWGAAAVAGGALGNGTANDRAAIQACLDAAEAGQVVLEGGFDFAVGSPLFMRVGTTLMGWGATLRPTSGFSGGHLIGVDPNNHQSVWKVEGMTLRARDSGGTVRANNGVHVQRVDNENRYHFEFLEFLDFPGAGILLDNESWALSMEQIRCANCGIGIQMQQGGGPSSFGASTTQGWHNVSVIGCTVGVHLQDYVGFVFTNLYAEDCDTAIRFGRNGEGGPVFRGGHVKNCDLWIGTDGSSTGHSRPSFMGFKFEGSATSGTLIRVPTHTYIGFYNCQFAPNGSPTVIDISSGGTAFFFEPDLDLRGVTTSCGNGSTIAMVLNGQFYRRTNNGSWSNNLW